MDLDQSISLFSGGGGVPTPQRISERCQLRAGWLKEPRQRKVGVVLERRARVQGSEGRQLRARGTPSAVGELELCQRQVSRHPESPRAVGLRDQPPEAAPCREIPGCVGDEAGAQLRPRIGLLSQIRDESRLSGRISHHDRPPPPSIARQPRNRIELQEAVGQRVERREPPLRGRDPGKPPEGVCVLRVKSERPLKCLTRIDPGPAEEVSLCERDMGIAGPPFGVIGANGQDLPRALIRRRVVAAEKGSDCLEHPAMMLGQTITMPQRMIQRDLVPGAGLRPWPAGNTRGQTWCPARWRAERLPGPPRIVPP